MSRFAEFDALAVTEAAVRGRVAPLLGKERAVLEALRAAEDAYDRCRETALAERAAEAELQAKMRAKGGD